MWNNCSRPRTETSENFQVFTSPKLEHCFSRISFPQVAFAERPIKSKFMISGAKRTSLPTDFIKATSTSIKNFRLKTFLGSCFPGFLSDLWSRVMVMMSREGCSYRHQRLPSQPRAHFAFSLSFNIFDTTSCPSAACQLSR